MGDSGVGAFSSGRPPAPVKVQRGVDDAHVTEGLGEIAQHALESRIVLLGKQAHIIAQPHQALKKGLGLGIRPCNT